jgi:uncharacterized protein YndB with AHSA1/START domain
MDIDVFHYLGAVERRVDSGEIDGKAVRVVKATRVFDTDVDDLWDAVSRAERLARWFLPVEGDLRVGGRFQVVGNAGGVIERCEPPKALAVTWEAGGNMSWLAVTVSDAPGGRARLELAHAAPVEGGEAFWEQFGPGATGVGWDQALIGLGLHLATGEANDAAAFQAWALSEPGKAFTRAASEDWGRASIAFGTDEAAARAAAGRTTAFYTGEGEPAACEVPAT